MDNSHYKKIYGAWAGNSGHKPDFTRCCTEVTTYMGRWPSSHQCSRKRGHGPGKAYCRQHDPEVVKARQEKADRENRIRWNRERMKWHGPIFYKALEEIVAGHNDPRSLAKEVLNEFHKGD